MNLLLDIIVAGLLFATVLYCIRLNRKIALLQSGREELGDLIREFNTSIAQAEHNITQLKELGEEADGKLTTHIQKARFLANDLSFLMSKGESVADKLENHINRTNPGEKIMPSSRPAKAAASMGGHNVGSPRTHRDTSTAQSSVRKAEQALRSGREMTPSKQKALEEALTQIASLKSMEAKKPVKQELKNQPVNRRPERDTDRIFNKRRLTESLKSTQTRT